MSERRKTVAMSRVGVLAAGVLVGATLGCARERPPEAPNGSVALAPLGKDSGPGPKGGPRGASAPRPSSGAATPSADDARLEEKYRHCRPLSVLRGRATYYGNALAGRRTASGEVYDPRRFTAAHRTLPFGTVVRVLPAGGGATAYVRITDRGPFGDARRIIDLSRAAAERLGILRMGVADVRVEVLEYGRRRR